MIKTCFIHINGIKRQVNINQTIMQACESYGISIPHFCFHDKLSVAGNCRMCLVEETKSPKPLASCAVTVSPNMNIYTNTPLVKKAREGVLEFLLANHPLDCPICDQGGECDLQDQSLVFGGDRGRFYENKRAVSDKYCGPLVKTIMTRCIHCTRCVRFASEIAGLKSFGVTGRGSKMEIGFYINNLLNSEVSGNIIDLCPVGALTSKPFAFTARSWELTSSSSIDIFDAFGSNIRIDSIGNRILRVLPVQNKLINDSWIADKIRFAYDSFKIQRITTPYILKESKHIKVSWDIALSTIASYYKKYINVHFLIGKFTNLESQYAIKHFANRSGSNAIFNPNLKKLQTVDTRSSYLFNYTLADFETIDFCLLLDTNPRWESPLLNIKLKQLAGRSVTIYNIGFYSKLNYYTKHLGSSMHLLRDIANGQHFICYYLLTAKKPLILVGARSLHLISLLEVLRSRLIQYNLGLIKNFISVLHSSFSDPNTCELNLTLSPNRSLRSNSGYGYGQVSKLVFAFNDVNDVEVNSADYLIHQTPTATDLTRRANVVLPSLAFIEDKFTSINNLGIVQLISPIFFDVSTSLSDTEILARLATICLPRAPTLDIQAIHSELSLTDVDSKANSSVYVDLTAIPNPFLLFFNTTPNYVSQSHITNYYLTDFFSKNSKVMGQCASSFTKNTYTF